MNELLRGAIRLHILHHAETAAVHGAWLTEELRGHGYHVSPGTLYPTLHRMEEEGLLASTRAVSAGRSCREYRLTPAGRRALRDDRKVLKALADEVLG